MGTINVNEVKPGMVLAKPVFDFRKNLILPEGAEIKESHLRLFKIWGINEVDVVGVKEESLEELKEKIKDDPHFLALSRELDNKFSDVLDNKIMVEFLRLAKKRLVIRMVEEQKRLEEFMDTQGENNDG